MNFFIADAWAADPGPQGSFLQPLIMLVIFIGIMYFMLIRPQQKRAKEHRELLDSLSKGDEVVTGGGLLGKVTNLGENYVEISVADNTTVKIQRQSVGAVVPKGTMKSL